MVFGKWFGRLKFSGARTPDGADGRLALTEDLDALMRAAYASHESGDPVQAEKLYRAILSRQPDSVDANYMLGELAWSMGRQESAAELVGRAIELNPAIATFHDTLARILQARGKKDEAIASYRRSLALEGSNAAALNNLGCLLLERKMDDEARECFETAVSIEPSFGAAQFNLGGVLARQKELEKAEQCFRAVKPRSIPVLESLSEALVRQGKHSEVPGLYREIVRLRLDSIRDGGPPEAGSGKVHVKNTTLCCIDCCYHDLAIHAIKRSMQRCSYDRVLFLTDKSFDIEGVEVVRIDALASMDGYSHFMLKSLNKYIQTDFVLVIQYDGYVLDASQWTERFQDYDYIGARWPKAGRYRVGNGGFSLRSKRLLEALQDDRIPLSNPEDSAICVEHRPFLEQTYGIRFPPEDLAERFSFEGIPRMSGTFGFHGVGHLVSIAGKSDADIAAYRGNDFQMVEYRI